MDRKPTRTLTPEERDLFRREAADAAPLSGSQRRRPEPATPSTRPLSREADEAAVIASLLDQDPEDVETGEEFMFRRPGIQLATLRRLRRGQYRCDAELDLHGQFVNTARHALAVFLAEARELDHRCVRIIHGKGLRSGNRGPVLRQKVAGWLRQRNEVLAYCSARRVDGGTGAVYVLLKRA